MGSSEIKCNDVLVVDEDLSVCDLRDRVVLLDLHHARITRLTDDRSLRERARVRARVRVRVCVCVCARDRERERERERERARDAQKMCRCVVAWTVNTMVGSK